jgi:hypothetical protein
VVALLVIGGVAWFAFSGATDASAAQVQLEATSTAGPSPFTAPVGQDATGVVAPTNAQGSQPGNTGGLYAQDPAKASCDSAALVSQLSSDPTKAAAWGQPLGVEANGISGFVNSLSPVTLRADTAVTEYGYGSGQFQPYPATLQAGTAVMVNSYGEPTVKCYNGDPLGAPTSSNNSTTVVGAPWNGYVAERTIIVTPAPAPQSTIIVVNPGTNTPTPKPVPPPVVTTPNPPPPTTGGQLLLTGTHNYDGTITLSDGRVIGPDNKVIPPKANITHPPGSTTFPDGSVKEPSGLIFNKDGTERRPIPVIIGGKVITTINPDGTSTPTIPGTVIKWNYDGTVSTYVPGAGGGNQVLVLKPPDGSAQSTTSVPPGGVIQPDGSIKTTGGVILNPNGTPRQGQTLPDGTTLDPQGGNTPPKAAVVDNTFKGQDGKVGQKEALVQEGQPGTAGQPGVPGQAGQPGQASPACAPGSPGAADPACTQQVPGNKQACVAGAAPTPQCPAKADTSGQTGTSTDGSSTSGTGSGSGTSGSESGSGSEGGSGSSGSSGGSSSGESGGSSSGG